MADLWVFAYGSLMWRPGFAYVEAREAVLTGYRRCFCIYSVHHRGSAARPGLVLGLDRGGACHGIAFRVAAAEAAETLRYLREREQVNGVYREARVPLSLHGGVEIEAVAYLAERAHPSFAGDLPAQTQARLIRAARGLSGANLDYLANTLEHLRSLGIQERALERVLGLCGTVMVRRRGVERRPSPAALVATLAGHGPKAPRMSPLARRRFLYRQRLSGG